jgi:hypothetical protein
VHMRACVRACTHNCSEVAPEFQKLIRGIAVRVVLCLSSVGWVIHFSLAIGRYPSVPGDGAMRGNAPIHDTTTACVLMVNEISNRGRMSLDQRKVRLACLLHGAESFLKN